MKKLFYLFIVATLIFAGCQKEPIVDFTASKTTVEVGEMVTFSNSTIDGYDYDWEFGDGQSSTEENPTHSYTIAGAYTVSLTSYSKNGKKSDKTTLTITVVAKPTICKINKITFTSYPEDDNGYYWDSAVSGYYPDIYFKFFDDNSSVFFDATSSNRIENVNSTPFYWTFSTALTFDLDKIFYVGLYDYDTLDSQYMGGCGGNTLNDYNNYPYPSTITIQCTSVAYTLDVTWE